VHAQLLCGVPVQFGIQRVPVKLVAGARIIIVRVAGRPGDVRRRNHRGDPRGNRIDAFGRDDVVRERGAPTAVGVAGPWVIDQPRGFEKTAPPARQGRHGGKPGSELSLAGALVAGEEEKLIAFDRSAERAAELVIYELRVAFPLWQKKIL